MKVIFSVEDVFVVEPLGIMQMAAVAKRQDCECLFMPYTAEGFLDLIVKQKPQVIAFSIMSTSDATCKGIIHKIKKIHPESFIIVGGPHPTYYPDFIKTSEADALCVGEGDGAFAELLNSLRNNQKIGGIANIYTRVSQTAPRNLEENLDSLPFACRDLVYRNTRLGKSKLKSFMATRGCPYSCAYCFNSGYMDLYRGKGRLLRRRSVDNLIEEIKQVKTDYPLEIIRFGDDVFIEKLDDWFYEFTEKYTRMIKLPFYCLLSPKVVSVDMAKRLKKAGCVSVATSIETGNQVLRYDILRRRISDEEIIKACRILVENGIKTFTNIMLGLPCATLEDEFKSIELAVKSKTTYASFTIFTPFPGTLLHRECQDKGLIPKMDRLLFPRSTTDRSILNCFTERQKSIQKNIMLLGGMANGSKLLRPLILRWLIFLPSNRVFFYISFFVRNYYHYRHIWPMKLGLKDFFAYVELVFRHDRKYIE